jgi:hypothetical protein
MPRSIVPWRGAPPGSRHGAMPMRLTCTSICVAITLAGSGAFAQVPALPGSSAPVWHRQPAPTRSSPRRGSQGGAAWGGTIASANPARWRQPAAHAPSRAKLRGRGTGIRRARPRQEGLSCRRDHGAGHAEAELAQICRVRQERLRRHGENRRSGELCRTVVLRRDIAGRAQYPQCRCTGERQRLR